MTGVCKVRRDCACVPYGSLSVHALTAISKRSIRIEKMDGSTNTYSKMFSGKRLLVAESGYFLTDEVRQKLRKLGAAIIGPVDDLEYAADIVDANEADAAVLDLAFTAERVFPLVERLDKQSIPYLFALRRESIVVDTKFTGFVLCEKPAAIEHIAKALFGTSNQV